jgi:hypothetical protein
MTDPVFLIAATGVGLSGIVSAIRLINWFLEGDPKTIAQAGPWAAVGLLALSLPFMLGLIINQRWLEAIALSVVTLIAFTIYGPRLLNQLFPPRATHGWHSPDPQYARSESNSANGFDSELVQRSITVLEQFLRCNATLSERHVLHPPTSSPVSDPCWLADPHGHPVEIRAYLMSEAEALQVLGLGTDPTDSEIHGAHRRLMRLIHPDRGGSPYFAVKVNQAKEVLIGRSKSRSAGDAGLASRRRRHARQQTFARTKPTTRG